MRFHRRAALAATIFAAPICAAVAGCGGDDTTGEQSGVDASADGDATVATDSPTTPDTSSPQDTAAPDSPGLDSAVPDGATPDSGTDAPALDAADAAPTSAFVRIAWFAMPGYPAPPPAPAAGTDAAATPATTYDACIAPHGTQQWQGPLLANAGTAGLSLYDVSAYFPVPPGQWDVRLVTIAPGGTPTCAPIDDSGAPLTDFTALPSLVVGDALTAAVTPSYDKSNSLNLGIVPLLDDTSAAPGSVAVRFANVADPALDPLSFGLGGGVVFTPWFLDVTATQNIAAQARRPAYGAGDAAAVGDGGIDSYGYAQVQPFAQIDTTIMDGTQDLGSSGSIAAHAGAVLSAFAVPGFPADGNGPTAGLVVCFDGQAGAASAFLTKCTAIGINDAAKPPPTETRFGNFIADPGFPAIDSCVKYHSQSTFAAPIGGRQTDGGILSVDYGTMTYRYDIHAGFSYDLRVVQGGATDCSVALAPDTTYTPPAGLAQATVVYTGYVKAPDGGLSAVDAGTGSGLATDGFTPLVIPDLACGEGSPVVRIANVAGVSPAPINVAYSGGTPWTINSVPYGSTSSTSTLDACGYLGVTTSGTGTLSVGSVDFVYGIGTGTQDTIYVFSSGGTLQALDCSDNDPTLNACGPLPTP